MSQLRATELEFIRFPISSPHSAVQHDGRGYLIVQQTAIIWGLLGHLGCSVFLLPLALMPVMFLLSAVFDREEGSLNWLDFGPRFLVSDGGYITWAETLVGLFFTLLFLAPAYYVVRSVINMMVWKPPCLRLPAPQLERGVVQTLIFEHCYRSDERTLEQGGVVYARLVCQEVTRTRRGTTYNYNSQELHSLTLKPSVVPALARGYIGTFEVTLPENSPPTRISGDNWIAWKLQVKTRQGEVWNDETSFVVEVV